MTDGFLGVLTAALLVGGSVGVLAGWSPVVLIGVVLVASLALLAIVYTRAAVLLMVAAIPLVPSLPGNTFVKNVRPDELLLLFLLMVIAVKWGAARCLSLLLPRTTVDWVWLCVQGATVLSLFFAVLFRPELLTISSYLSVVKPLQYFILYKILVAFFGDLRDEKQFFHALLWPSVVVAGIGILALKYPPLETLLRSYYSRPGGGYFPYRVSSTFDGQPDYVGGYLILINCLAFSRLLERSWKDWWYLIPVLLLNNLALYDTLSRGALVGQAVGYAIVLVLSHSRRYLVPLAAISVVLMVLVFPGNVEKLSEGLRVIHYQDLTLTREYGISDRVALWADQMRLMGSNVVVGSGPVNANTFYSDNQYIAKIVQFGLVGLLGFLWWLGLYLRDAAAFYRRASSLPQGYWGLGTFAGVSGLAIHAFTLEPFTAGRVAEIIWILLAVVVAVSHQKDVDGIGLVGRPT
ncbi:MAG TPA: O-antigen ligase family protein [Symbiobacteriaceae bacterium]